MTNPYNYRRGGGRPARLSKLTGTWSGELDDLIPHQGLSDWEMGFVLRCDDARRSTECVSPAQAAKIAEIWDAMCGERETQQ